MPGDTFRVVMSAQTRSILLAEADAMRGFAAVDPKRHDGAEWTFCGRPVDIDRTVPPGAVRFVTNDCDVCVTVLKP